VLAPWKIFIRIALAIRLSFPWTVARGSLPCPEARRCLRVARRDSRIPGFFGLEIACSRLLLPLSPSSSAQKLAFNKSLFLLHDFLFRALALLRISKVDFSCAPASSQRSCAWMVGQRTFGTAVEGWKNSPSAFSFCSRPVRPRAAADCCRKN
jgi:hypothetical protein